MPNAWRPAADRDAAQRLCRSRAIRGDHCYTNVVATLPPFTHHEILGLVEPFTRRGRHPDLAASSRPERRLQFKPVAHTELAAELAGLQEQLRLENPYAGFYRLIRTLQLPGRQEATLYTEGAQPAELLARIEAVAPARQFRWGEGYMIAQSYRLEPLAGASREPSAPPLIRLLMSVGVARAGGLTLVLTPSTVKGYPADIKLIVSADDDIKVPEDLLAVLGWNWAPLRRDQDGWNSRVRLRGNEDRRSQQAEVQLEAGARHLARTLAEPPARFHQRLRAARWGVVFRRAIPLLSFLLLFAGALAVPYIELAQESAIRMLIFNSPPLLMAIAFCLQELPRFEIPPMPRVPGTAWRSASLDSARDGMERNAGQRVLQ
jgi:hypothetical protein